MCVCVFGRGNVIKMFEKKQVLYHLKTMPLSLKSYWCGEGEEEGGGGEGEYVHLKSHAPQRGVAKKTILTIKTMLVQKKLCLILFSSTLPAQILYN